MQRRAGELARIANDGMAELVRHHGDRFCGFVAAVSLLDVESAIAELERAVGQSGACGVQTFTNIKGRPLDDAIYRPFFAAVAARGVPIWLHPARGAETTDYAAEPRSRFEMWWCFGWPYDTSVAMTRLALSGLFDRHPDLKIITHHLGGMIPYFDKRIESGLAVLGARTSDEDYSGVLSSLKRPHIDYLKMFYADTALFGAGAGLPCGIEFFGSEHVVFASDAPFGPITETRDAIATADLDAAARAAIFSGNVEGMLAKRR